MHSLNQVVRALIGRRVSGERPITLLAACPNSDAVLEAAVLAAARYRAPMLFAATLNQVDRDGGYTGWTPAHFVGQMRLYASKYQWDGPLYPCLDHGGPWLKDRHTLDGLSYAQTMAEVKASLSACLEAGYQLLHIDPTVDRSLPPGTAPDVSTVVARTLELIEHAEGERQRLGLPEVAYEVGTEEVHGGLVDYGQFERFLRELRLGLRARGMVHTWPTFIVAQVGTDLHTTTFDSAAAEHLTRLVAPLGSLIKGHYTDWVENPEAYPQAGMGGANVGPEFTAAEVLALAELEAREVRLLGSYPGAQPSRFGAALEKAVVESSRWKKWLQPGERGLVFGALSHKRRTWLVQTGARYIWTAPDVLAARRRLYANLAPELGDPNAFVVECITGVMAGYIAAFNLENSVDMLEKN
jgi:D-tagatose-1,6-bisphosphate aldolase subunit GatZ/KbaZ